ncbi:MAG: isocitrate lyase/phosphoenolpyruvate mutase family protein [Pseudomonadota bacterium]
MSQQTQFDAFAALHVPGNPVVLFNVWDVGSARAVETAGAKAVATGSHSVAGANGYADGEDAPLDLVVENAARIVVGVDLPVSIDFEAGYGDAPEAAAGSLRELAETGIVGVNIEDGHFGAGIRPVEKQAQRLSALSEVRSSSGVPVWINARTDVFLQSAAETHADHVSEALERGDAYAQAGGHSYFIPGLLDLDLIAKVCESTPLPVNVMATGKGPSVSDFASAGVGRVSFGGYPWHLVMKNLADATRDILNGASRLPES